MDKEDTDVQEDSSAPEEQVVEPVESTTDSVVILEEEKEAVAEEESVKEEPEAEPDTEEEAPKEEKRQEPKIPLSRLRQESQKRKAEEAKRIELEKQLQELTSGKTEKVDSVASGKPKAPKLSDFGYDDEKFSEAMSDYQDSLVDWKLEQRDAARKAQSEKDRVTRSQEEHQERLQKFYDSNAEYQKVLEEVAMMDEEIHYPPVVAHAISTLENGPEIDLLILKNREEVLPALQRMSPEQQLMYIGQLQAQSSVSKSQPVAQKKTTNAPPPIETNIGGSSAPKDEDSLLRESFGGSFVLK